MASIVISGHCAMCGQPWQFNDSTIHPAAHLYIDTDENTFSMLCVNSQLCEERQANRAQNGDPMPSNSAAGGVHNRPVGQPEMHVTLSPSPVPGMPPDILPSNPPRKAPMSGLPDGYNVNVNHLDGCDD